jgi:hypothetical protein
MLSVQIEADFAIMPSIQTQHYFVTVDDTDPNIDEEAAGLNPAISKPQSSTRFLMLLTVTTRINPKRGDPLVNFKKSIILASDQYVEATYQIKYRREEAAMAKERIREERVESKNTKWLGGRRLRSKGHWSGRNCSVLRTNMRQSARRVKLASSGEGGQGCGFGNGQRGQGSRQG